MQKVESLFQSVQIQNQQQQSQNTIQESQSEKYDCNDESKSQSRNQQVKNDIQDDINKSQEQQKYISTNPNQKEQVPLKVINDQYWENSDEIQSENEVNNKIESRVQKKIQKQTCKYQFISINKLIHFYILILLYKLIIDNHLNVYLGSSKSRLSLKSQQSRIEFGDQIELMSINQLRNYLRLQKIEITLSSILTNRTFIFWSLVKLLLIGYTFLQMVLYINNYQIKLQQEGLDVGKNVGLQLENQLKVSITSTYTLSSIIEPSKTGEQFLLENFFTVSDSIIKKYKGIDSLQLAPNAVVDYINQIQGNEGAVGHDLINDPKRRNDTLKSIYNNHLFFSGPLTLIQNGKKAIIARKPCYSDYSTSNYTSKDGKKFWGFVTLLSLLDDIFDIVNLDSIHNQFGYDYKLINTIDQKVITTSQNINQQTVFQNYVEININYQDANIKWKLVIQIKGFWDDVPQIFIILIILILIKFFGFVIQPLLFAKSNYRLQLQQAYMRSIFTSKTKTNIEKKRCFQQFVQFIEQTLNIFRDNFTVKNTPEFMKSQFQQRKTMNRSRTDSIKQKKDKRDKY